MVAFTILDTAAKYLTRYLPPMEIAWVRFLSHFVLAAIILRPWRNWSLYRTRRPLAQILRSVFLFGSTIFNFLALQTLRLDQTTTILFSAAFVVTALSVPILGERVGIRRWVAVGVGFVGVLVVIRPGTSGFEPAMLYSVGAMLSYSGYILFTRHMSTTDSAEGMLLISALVPSILLAPISLPDAVLPPTLLAVALLLLTGVVGATGHWMLIHAHRMAPTNVLSPFLYTQLVWMTLAGYLAFDQLPDRYTLIGAALIVGSALYILYRQRVHGDH